jgi:hypothetical protein
MHWLCFSPCPCHSSSSCQLLRAPSAVRHNLWWVRGKEVHAREVCYTAHASWRQPEHLRKSYQRPRGHDSSPNTIPFLTRFKS